MTVSILMMLPKTIISKPIVAVVIISIYFWLNETVFAQATSAIAPDDFTYYAGRVAIIVAIVAIAVAAVYNAFRKAAITEYKDLAEARRGKLIEKELENTNLRTEVNRLRDRVEDLTKKNLRLQGPSEDQ